MKEDKHPNEHGVYSIFDLAISILFYCSKICIAFGAIVLVLFLIIGGGEIENIQLVLLGILLYFPLRYLKGYLDKRYRS